MPLSCQEKKCDHCVFRHIRRQRMSLWHLLPLYNFIIMSTIGGIAQITFWTDVQKYSVRKFGTKMYTITKKLHLLDNKQNWVYKQLLYMLHKNVTKRVNKGRTRLSKERLSTLKTVLRQVLFLFVFILFNNQLKKKKST